MPSRISSRIASASSSHALGSRDASASAARLLRDVRDDHLDLVAGVGVGAQPPGRARAAFERAREHAGERRAARGRRAGTARRRRRSRAARRRDARRPARPFACRPLIGRTSAVARRAAEQLEQAIDERLAGRERPDRRRARRDRGLERGHRVARDPQRLDPAASKPSSASARRPRRWSVCTESSAANRVFERAARSSTSKICSRSLASSRASDRVRRIERSPSSLWVRRAQVMRSYASARQFARVVTPTSSVYIRVRW